MIRRGVQAMPLMERPREKLRAKGAQALSDQELLAVILGSGTKKINVMELAGRLLRILDEKGKEPGLKDLCAMQGLGVAKGSLVLAALEFARRRIRPHGLKITLPTDVFPLIRHYAIRRQEHFFCISLNGANEVLAIRTVSVGLVNRALVHPREVYADPITDRASAIIVAHNHPSGQLMPSQDDLGVTRQLSEAGRTLGIRLLDHLIFNFETYYSFLEQGKV